MQCVRGDERESEEEERRASPSLPHPLSETRIRTKVTSENYHTAASKATEEVCQHTYNWRAKMYKCVCVVTDRQRNEGNTIIRLEVDEMKCLY